MKLFKQSVIIFGVMFLFGCESEPSKDLQDSLGNNSVDQASIQQTLAINATSNAVGDGTTQHLYDPGAGVLPSAIDILFKDSKDGTLNIPIAQGDPQAALKTVLSAMDGFSTGVPVTTRFSAAIDPATITSTAVRMFEVGLSGFGKAVVSIKDELTFGDDFAVSLSSVDPTNSTLAIVPYKRPLKADTSYYVVITNSLKDMSGNSVKPSSVYSLAKNANTTYVDSSGVSLLPGVSNADAATLETLRQLISASEFTVDYALEDLSSINIVASWSFTTQSVGKTLTTVRSLVGTPATNISASTAVVSANGPGKSLLGAANMFEGTLTVPYYLTAPSVEDPTAILTKPWSAANEVGDENNLTRLNTLPAATNSALEIPVLMTAPVDTETFPAPWKTVIFQHGITSNRTVMLAVADTLAQAGFATVAIDMPLHGVDSNSPLYQAGKERTFDVDYVTQDGSGNITAQVPDSVVDSSGRHFINLSNLLVTRDNVRQAVADLFALTAAIPAIDVDGGGPDLDGDNIFFVGHSLGAMVGTTFLALEPKVKDAVLAFGGASYAKILDGSAAFSPSIVAGLAAGTGGTVDKNATGAARAAYESFMGVAQIAVDTADPVNFSTAAVANRGLLFFEIAGDGTPGTSDLVVPNTVPDALAAISTPATVPAPLAGTEPQLSIMELQQVNSSQSGTDLKLSVKFTSGDHGSILDPSADAAVTTEIQKEMASFLATAGNVLTVTDTSVIQTP
jgi:pimeloyl-ACP methyl ester carboxylesterase